MPLVTVKERPSIKMPMFDLAAVTWPKFMLMDPVGNTYWDSLYEVFPAFQMALLNDKDTVIASANSIPLRFDEAWDTLPEEGWRWALRRGFADKGAGYEPNILCALSIVIHPDSQGQGLSHEMVRALREAGKNAGMKALIAPVRPNLKARYPLIPMEDYITWRRDDGEHQDAWLRVHERAGGKIMRVCPFAMHIHGSVSAWERWTNTEMPFSGSYTVPGALVPIRVNLERDRGDYIEPNVWVVHDLAETA